MKSDARCVSQSSLRSRDRLVSRRTLLQDPDAGNRQTFYNAFGEVREEIDGDLRVTDLHRDTLGRVFREDADGKTSSFTWDLAANGMGRMESSSSAWGASVHYAYEPRAWDILIRSDRAAPEEREFAVDAYDPTPLHRIGLAVHKNLRLALVSGENFPNILHDPGNKLYRDLYRRTVHHLLDSARVVDAGANPVPAPQRDSALIALSKPVRIDTLRYDLPEFLDYKDPAWHRKPAPYAHYIIEGSGTVVTGGTIVRPAAGSGALATIENGVTRHVTKGDVIIVPENSAHWYKDIESQITYLEVRWLAPAKK